MFPITPEPLPFRSSLHAAAFAASSQAHAGGRRRWTMAAWLFIALFFGVRLDAVAASVMPITTVGEFWNVPEAEKNQSHPLHMEVTVTYYDAAWNLLWVFADGQGSYLPVRNEIAGLESGRRVRLTGTVVPAEGIDGTKVEATVLETDARLEPLSTSGAIRDYRRFDARWVTLDGYVFNQTESDPSHMLLALLVEDYLITLRLKLGGSEPVPQLAGARIRAHVVYVAGRDPAGELQQVDAWCPGANQIEVVGWLQQDERFKLPVTTIEQLPDARAPWVRVTGEMQAQEAGKSITVRDATGVFTVNTPQPEILPLGAAVEVVGQPSPDGGWTLKNPLFRRVVQGAAVSTSFQVPGAMPVRLRLAEQVLQLAPQEAAKGYPVTLRGVVTWAGDEADFLYLQDSSGGVRVRRPARATKAPVGASVILSGVTARGAYVPEIELQDMTYLGTRALPAARSITLDQALSGAQEGLRVEMRGFVQRVSAEGAFTRIDLTSATGEFAAYLPTDDSLGALRNALVRVRGVCTSLSNATGEPAEIRLWLQDRDAITVDEVAPADPFSLALQTTAGLRQFSATRSFNSRAHLAGTVLLHEPGRFLYLQDQAGGILVLTRSPGQLQPGDAAEVVGYAGRSGSRLLLREATWRELPKGERLPPASVSAADGPLPNLDARLVELDANLRQVSPDADKLRLSLQTGEKVVQAVLHSAAGWVSPPIGSRLHLTGVYVVGYDEYRRPHDFHLEIPNASAISVVQSPPWWTLQRIWSVFGALLLVCAAGLAWVLALRRRVQAQTEQIRGQMEKETRLQAELERSSRLESLGVLAGGIAHDFNNLLTAVLGNLGLAAMDKRVMAAAGDCISEAERAARRARDVTQQLLTFAKGGDPVRSSVLLPDIISEAANFARHGSTVRLEFIHPPDLPPGDVDAGQISRVVHNLVLNAVQAMPEGGIVKLALSVSTLGADEVASLAAGTYLVLSVSDAGRGIPREDLDRIFDPYFSTKTKGNNSGLGLATVRSIVRKHGGHVEVESHLGVGSTFRVWLPAATRPSAASVAPSPIGGRTPARILVMDDEEVIRRVAGRMLALAGHDAAFASDGAEAVRAYLAAKRTSRPFDLVIFDLTVPGGMGGRDALQSLLKVDPQIRAIASSGYSSDPIMANPREFGFMASLPKPYDIPDVVRAVEEVRTR